MATKIARRRGPSPALNNARNQIANLRSRLTKVRRAAKNNQAGAMEGSIAIVAGGAAAGAAQTYMPDVAGVDTRLAAGGALLLLGTYGLEGKPGALTTLAGAGMLACWAQDMTADMLAGDVEGE